MKKIENLKDNIIIEAVKILKDEPKNLSIRKLATACNVGVGTMYNYYKNKDEVMIDCMRYYWSKFMEDIQSTSWSKDKRENLSLIYQIFKEYGNTFRVELLNNTDPAVIQKARAFHQQSFNKFIELIETVLQVNDYDLSEFIAFNLYASLRTPGYDYTKLERIVFKKLID